MPEPEISLNYTLILRSFGGVQVLYVLQPTMKIYEVWIDYSRLTYFARKKHSFLRRRAWRWRCGKTCSYVSPRVWWRVEFPKTCQRMSDSWQQNWHSIGSTVSLIKLQFFFAHVFRSHVVLDAKVFVEGTQNMWHVTSASRESHRSIVAPNTYNSLL